MVGPVSKRFKKNTFTLHRASLPDKIKYDIIVYKSGEEIERIKLNQKDTVVFGRNSQLSDHVLLHETVSRQHAALIWKKTGELYVGKRCRCRVLCF